MSGASPPTFSLPARPSVWALRTDRLDPLSAASARPVTIAFASSMVLLAGLDTLLKRDQVTSGWWLAATFVALIAAMLLLIDRTRLERPAWSRASAVLVHVLLIAMMLFAALSTAGANVSVRDDWAPVGVGLAMFALTSYRSARELAAWATVHTAVAAALGWAQAPAATAPWPGPLMAIAGSFGLFVLGSAAVAYTLSMNALIRAWEVRAWTRAAAVAHDARGGVARSVRQREISRVGREALPVLSRVADSGVVTSADREEAADRAASIRRALVDAAGRGWARELADDLIERRPELTVDVVVDDPDDVARQATLEQRTLIRALVAAAMDAPGTQVVRLAIAAAPHRGGPRVRVEVRSAEGSATVREALGDLVGVVRGLARQYSVVEVDGALVIEFAYGH